MKPQDIVILAQLFCEKDAQWTVESVSKDTGISRSETSNAIKRLISAGLFSDIRYRPVIAAMEEFLIHGIRYVYPAVFLSDDRGIVTAYSAQPLSDIIVSDGSAYVWAHPEGTVRGICIKPLHPSVPDAALRNAGLYAILSLVDALRTGRARERSIAADILSDILRGKRPV